MRHPSPLPVVLAAIAALTAALLPASPTLAAPAKAPTLEAVIERLRRETGANIVPMWHAIEGAGIRRDTPVDVRANRLPAGRLLRLALDAASAGREADARLDFVVDDGIVIIAPRKLLGEKTVTRAYTTSDLAMPVPHFTDAPTLSLNSVLPAFNAK